MEQLDWESGIVLLESGVSRQVGDGPEMLVYDLDRYHWRGVGEYGNLHWTKWAWYSV